MTDLQWIWRMANSMALRESLPAHFESSRLIRDGLLPFCDWPCRVRKRRRSGPDREGDDDETVPIPDADNGPEMNNLVVEVTPEEWHLIDWERPLSNGDGVRRSRSWLIARFVGFASRQRVAEWFVTNDKSNSEPMSNIRVQLSKTDWNLDLFRSWFCAGSRFAIRHWNDVFCSNEAWGNETWGLALVVPESTLPGIPSPDPGTNTLVICATPKKKPADSCL
jgi:hypothetical protein